MSAVVEQPRGNDPQRLAADPAASAWVTANAGSGKTHVLTRRVIRLLLSGTKPERLLCLTYTRAAAAEMATRLYDELGHWSTMNDADLALAVGEVTGAAPLDNELIRARRLFAQALEAPGGLKIQTIHAFCERLLKRFALEAGVTPHFEVLDARTTQELMEQARDQVLERAAREARRGDGTPLSRAVATVSAQLDETMFNQLISGLSSMRRLLRASREEHGGLERLIAEIYERLAVGPGESEQDIIRRALQPPALPEEAVRKLVPLLADGGSNDKKASNLIAAFLAAADRATAYDKYLLAYLTGDGDPRKRLMVNAVAEANPWALDLMENEQARMLDVEEHRRRVVVAHATAAMLRLADALVEAFDGIKNRRGLLDYDDLVDRTRELLRKEQVAPWVLFKLDGGLDHILIDEAQDTSPEQWEIVGALAEEFFAGSGAREILRTIFAVGDEKQSIYRFQGADPAKFDENRQLFAGKVTAAGKAWAPVTLATSFRSTSAVLDAVDAVFAQPAARDGLVSGGEVPPHPAFREGDAGLVEIWPTIEPDEDETPIAWNAPLDASHPGSPAAQLADRIASTIKGWLDRGEMLESAGRPIQPGDILILVRRRNRFFEEMVRALKAARIPMAGADRMVLNEQIAVMDLLALGNFAILPDDDLTLATVLKGPLVGLDEDTLFEIAHPRGPDETLWRALERCAADSSAVAAAHGFLAACLALADFAPPFEFYADLLNRGGRRDLLARLGPEAADPVDEFLALALQYERSHSPSLQGFLHWVESGTTEIKRDLDHGRNEVRVMTVHGAKGLEAGIVFLPDTCQVPKAKGAPELLAADEEEGGIVLWPVRKAVEVAETQAAKDVVASAERAEYRRLLYVAMTRARDRLYVAGYESTKKRPDGCWYDLVTDALSPLAETVTLDNGGTVLRISEPQTAPVRKEAEQPSGGPGLSDLADWARRPPPAEPPAARVTAPSLLAGAEAEPPALSPLGPDLAPRYLRGRLIHGLLELLADVPPAGRSAFGDQWLARRAPELEVEARDEIQDTVSGILDNPDFAPVFGPGSRAEIPLVGSVRLLETGEIVELNGRIDRLIVTDDKVMLVDFKTNRPPPSDISGVAPAYLLQMAAYRALLRTIFPGRTVETALLWTEIPALMPLPDDLLEGLAVAATPRDPP